MDLKELKPNSETITVELVHPTTEEPLLFEDGTPFSITVYAQHTREFKESQQKNVDLFQKKGKKKLTIMELEDSITDHLARITCDWNIQYENKKPKLTYQTAREIYNELFWVKVQIQQELEDAEVFTVN